MPFALDELIFNREAQEKRLNAPRLAGVFLVKTRETEDTYEFAPLRPRESSKRKWTARLAQRVSQQDEN